MALVLLLGQLPWNVQAGRFPKSHTDLISLYDSFKALNTGAAIFSISKPLSLRFPDFHITLVSGKLAPIEVDPQIRSGFVFFGRGEARFTPRHAVERQQLRRFTGSDSLVGRFDWLVLRSINDQYQLKNLSLIPEEDGGIPEQVTKFVTDSETYLLKHRGFNLASRMLTEWVLGDSKFVLVAFRNLAEDDRFPPIYYYAYDPYAHESIRLFQHRPKRIGKPFYTVCSYPEGDYLAPPPKPTLRITKYNGWLQIDNKGFVRADLGADVFTGGKKVKLLYFQLSNLLTLSAVKDEAGDSLHFIREPEESGFTVFFPDSAAPKDTLRLLFTYTGQLMEKNAEGNWFLKDRIYWHPRLGYYRRAKYKLIFKCPANLQIVSLGRLVKDWYENGWHLSYFIQDTPAKASLFAMGNFTRDAFWGPDSVFIEIFSRSKNRDGAFRRILADVANSLYFYSRYLAPYKFKTLKIVEAPRLDSQGFPGFINLTWMSFSRQNQGVMEALRSHEVAHQWWGNHVGWRTYRDQWLSEGFAEYMSALYLAWATPSSGLFHEILRAWRDDIIEGGNIGVSLGLRRFGFSKQVLKNSELKDTGPVYLGHRLGQKEPLDYYLFVYEKAAYILHMLRYYLMDDKTGSDEKFWQLLRSFTDRYSDQEPSTYEFMQFVSDFLQEDMSWFFNQWIMNNDIPSFEYSYQTVRQPEGYFVVGDVIQKEVPGTFRAHVPVRIIFKQQPDWRGRIEVVGDSAGFRFGPFEEAPKAFEFNVDYAILAKVKRRK